MDEKIVVHLRVTREAGPLFEALRAKEAGQRRRLSSTVMDLARRGAAAESSGMVFVEDGKGGVRPYARVGAQLLSVESLIASYVGGDVPRLAGLYSPEGSPGNLSGEAVTSEPRASALCSPGNTGPAANEDPAQVIPIKTQDSPPAPPEPVMDKALEMELSQSLGF